MPLHVFLIIKNNTGTTSCCAAIYDKA